jgi:hypothetical protein
MNTALCDMPANVTARIATGQIVGFNPDGIVRVAGLGMTGEIACNMIENADSAQIELRIGDAVLVVLPMGRDSNACILGRIGKYCHPRASKQRSRDHVAVEAKECLSLKCGEATMSLHKDGKVVIVGRDVLVRAKRAARVKGGSVAIN